MCKIHQYLVKIWTRVWSLIFWLILKVKLCFVSARLSVFVNIRRRYCRIGWAKNWTRNSCSYIHQIMMDFTFYILQGIVATQLRCGGMSSNHFITNFPQNVPVKKILRIGQYSTQIWTKLCGLLFWATLYIFAFYHAPSVNVKGDLRNIALLPRVRSHFATYWSDDNYRVWPRPASRDRAPLFSWGRTQNSPIDLRPVVLHSVYWASQALVQYGNAFYGANTQTFSVSVCVRLLLFTNWSIWLTAAGCFIVVLAQNSSRQPLKDHIVVVWGLRTARWVSQ